MTFVEELESNEEREALIAAANAANMAELEDWRAGKRRVFWRLRWNHQTIGATRTDLASRSQARRHVVILAKIKGAEPRLYRVTVRPR